MPTEISIPLPGAFLGLQCDIVRPLGSGTIVASSVPCQVTADFAGGRRSASEPRWTHVMMLNSDVDIRDGCTRTANEGDITFADGDEVRLPSGTTDDQFAVVWVEKVHQGTSRTYQRVFMLRL
ncbi:MAG: hypothetical protein R3B84_22230 [Zavarzinella sp.]